MRSAHTGIITVTLAVVLAAVAVVVSAGDSSVFSGCPSESCECSRQGAVRVIRCQGLRGHFPEFAASELSFGGLNIIRQQLTAVPPNALRNVPVRSVDFSRNSFRDGLHPDAFAGVESTLKDLVLSQCRLPAVPSSALANLTNLSVLKLDGNAITTLDRRVFGKMPNLKEVHLYRNRISRVDASAFHGLQRLEHLKLFENQLSRLPRKLFRKLSALVSLDISSNRIRHILPRTFAGLNSLKWLEMESNRVTTLSRKVLRGMPLLRYLKLESNPLTHVAGASFQSVRRLNYLSLDITLLESLQNDTFRGLNKLKTLNLGEVNRTQLPDGLLGPTLALQYFSLSDYSQTLEEIQPTLFHENMPYEKLNVWLVPVHTCRCDLPWISELVARGAYLHGYCSQGQPISCVKRRKPRVKEENGQRMRLKRKKSKQSNI